MSGIDWDFVQAHAKIKAAKYAERYNGASYQAAYNAYFDGYLENAAERESLRVINARLEGVTVNQWGVWPTKEKSERENVGVLDDLI